MPSDGQTATGAAPPSPSVRRPEVWSAQDLATAMQLVAHQKKAFDDEHPQDVLGRQAKQDVIHALEAASESDVARRSRYAVMRPTTSYFVTDVRRPGVSPAGIALSAASPVA